MDTTTQTKTQMARRILTAAAMVWGSLAATSTQAYLITGFAPAGSPPFFSNAVIPPGALVEDFEDGTLNPGLEIDFGGGFLTTVQLGGVGLPRVDVFPDGIWDGTRGLLVSEQPGITTTFKLPTTSFFGIGISDIEPDPSTSDLSISVNGLEVLSSVKGLAGFTAVDNQRQIYLTILPEVGDALISTVAFSHVGSAGGSVMFDRLAYVPEPAAVALLGLGLAGMGFMRRRGTRH